MIHIAFPAQLKRVGLAAAASVVAFGLIGASTYEFSLIGKADRPPSPADCRSDRMSGVGDCAGIDLPMTTTEAYEVAPGLTIVERVDG
ncbi:hypothetical protein [Chthonobacter albigriseus]|uniref:hypothetical protein n=1 Tax=Chthonobacter albigriseus TaxID=1683161 RepID=UPI0015EE6AAD|nr:hypothetical protein [Chthonobacter albigriseus]